MRTVLASFPRLFAFSLCVALCCLGSQARAAGSLMVWPIDPVLESDQRASALWLENRGAKPVLLQMRIFAWSQRDGEENYAEQREVIGSPPMIRIPSGGRQLLRLTRLEVPPPGSEQAYRVVIDEIPTPESHDDEKDVGKAIRFQMRYSVPLFLYGEGLWLKPDPDRKRRGEAGAPQLGWRIEHDGGKAYLALRNDGPVHARLTQVTFEQGGRSVEVSSGLLGYVLAHSSHRWPLPTAVAQGAQLKAKVNGSAEPWAIHPLP